MAKTTRITYRCSFCGKEQNEVQRLIAGPGGVYVCDECTHAFTEVLANAESALALPAHTRVLTAADPYKEKVGGLVRCSFCGKSREQVNAMIAGPGGVHICNECVDLCLQIIEEERNPAAHGHAEQTHAPSSADGVRKHLLDVDDWSASEIGALFARADAMGAALARPETKLDTLRGKVMVNLFYENSTRTRVSFELAGKKLGADVTNVTASASSVTKGESLIDTVRTLQALGARIVVVRSSQAGAPDLIARHIDGSVLNAGDGWHAHPTQALLDLYTIVRRLGPVRGRRIVILGDILHSRVARSNIWTLTAMGATVVLCGPPTLLPPAAADLYAARPVPGTDARREVIVEPHIERALEGADVVMALRLQRERQQAGLLPSIREYSAVWGLTPERLKLANPGALVLHPGPMNEGVEIDPAVAYGDASVIEEQVTNGVAIRMAALELVAGADQKRGE
ncbi:MAG: Aspartate carbamoyltransferase [Ktedonobacterales bacterium]|jgi:aspartate carbamoyltransferase catalytic subunit|nr:MAG: Aspartate carbamoyltransferase [Ktedonobacterales bacterium]